MARTVEPKWARVVTLRRLVLAAPFVFILHVVEEAPGFVAWFNRLVPRGITENSFMTVNAVALVITVVVATIVVVAPNAGSGFLLAAWVGCLMLANGLLHLVATIVHADYSPGVVTGTVVYIPFGVLLLRSISRDLALHPSVVAGAAAVGAIPMLVHGYLIVFRASRLF